MKNMLKWIAVLTVLVLCFASAALAEGTEADPAAL